VSGSADAWSSPDAVNQRLAAWWDALLPDRRTKALAEVERTLPDWLAQDLIRAGLPLEVNPGITDRSLSGQFVTPPLVGEFLAQKRVVAAPRRTWRCWRR
jgi:hypothetical protein